VVHEALARRSPNDSLLMAQRSPDYSASRARPMKSSARLKQRREGAGDQSRRRRHGSRPARGCQTIGTFGGIDILVNNAGTGIFAPIEQFSLDDLRS